MRDIREIAKDYVEAASTILRESLYIMENKELGLKDRIDAADHAIMMIPYLPTLHVGKANLIVRALEEKLEWDDEDHLFIDQAVESVNQALALDDGCLDALILLSDIYYRFGDQPDHIKCSVELLQKAKKEVDSYSSSIGLALSAVQPKAPSKKKAIWHENPPYDYADEEQVAPPADPGLIASTALSGYHSDNGVSVSLDSEFYKLPTRFQFNSAYPRQPGYPATHSNTTSDSTTTSDVTTFYDGAYEQG